MTPESGAAPALDAKEFSTLQAIAALRGFQLIRADGMGAPPTYLVSRWKLKRDLASLAEVRTFLTREGVGHAD